MKINQLQSLASWHKKNKQEKLDSRRLVLDDLEPVLNGFTDLLKVSQLGSSFESRPIYKIEMGYGVKKILIWTQMHGNESTGTKAVLDLLRWIERPGELESLRDSVLENCSICIIPMLNPDGSERYSRLDSQGIDLNRDVLEKRAPESRLLQRVLKEVNPNFCFNMHDQRTIFSVGSPPSPATLSFLAPSEDLERTITPGRIRTMEVIAAMNESLKHLLKGGIGRYTDEFYPTATGDNFQRMGYSTILIESGHFKGDYERQKTREFTFLALLKGLVHISGDLQENYENYFRIPDNEKYYLDRIVKGVKIGGRRADIGVYLKEELRDGRVAFIPTLDRFEDLSGFEADEIIQGNHLSFADENEAKNWLAIEFN